MRARAACLAAICLLSACGPRPTPDGAPAGADPSVIQFRIAEDEPGPGRVPMQRRGSDRTYYVRQDVAMDGRDLEAADLVADARGRPCIRLTFTEAGRERQSEVTAAHVGRRLAIVVDGELLMAPVIKTRIESHQGAIMGSFSEEEARGWVERINAAVGR